MLEFPGQQSGHCPLWTTKTWMSVERPHPLVRRYLLQTIPPEIQNIALKIHHIQYNNVDHLSVRNIQHKTKQIIQEEKH